MTYETFMTLAWYREHGSNADMRQQCEGLISQEIARIIHAQHEAEARRTTLSSVRVTFEERPSMPPPFSGPGVSIDGSLGREIERLRGCGTSATDISAPSGIPGATGIYTAASSSASMSASSSVGTC